MAQPDTQKSVPNNNIQMFPFGKHLICSPYQTETFKLPQNHIKYSPSCKTINIYNIKSNSYVFINGKRNEYELKYQNFDQQKTLGDKIRYIRLHAGLTKQQLANKVGVNYTCINNYELNHVNISFVKTDILKKIEQVCNVPQYTLFCDYLLYYETNQLTKDMLKFDIKQKDLAVFLNVNRNTVLKWKNKKSRPSIDIWRSTVKLFQDLKSLPKSDKSLYLSSKGKLNLLRTDCAASE